jgi:hypothetical protein
MPKLLTNLRIDEISSVDRGAGEGVKIMLMKRDDETSRRPNFRELFKDLNNSALLKFTPAPDFDDEDDEIIDDDQSPLPEKLEQFAQILIAANPELTREQAVYFLIHNAHGRALAEHLASVTKTKEPKMSRIEELTKLTKYIGEDPGNMHAISKHIIEKGETSLTEHDFTALLTEHCKRVKQPHESVAGAFSRIFENDIEVRQAHAICKSPAPQMSLVPTQVGGADALDVNNDRSKAYEQLKAMAEEQCRKSPSTTFAAAFERVFSDASNSEIAQRAVARPDASMAYARPR